MSALVLWRHSRTEYNVERRLQGSLDIALGPAGRAQAASQAKRLAASLGLDGDARIVSSPLQRAVASAQELAAVTGGAVTVDDAFTQRSYGVWEGLTWDEVRERWPEDHARRMRGEDPRIDGWGRGVDVAARVGEGLRRWWSPDRVTVVVSHGSAIQLGLLDLLGLEPVSRAFGKVAHGSWHVLRQAESGAWHVEAYGHGAD